MMNLRCEEGKDREEHCRGLQRTTCTDLIYVTNNIEIFVGERAKRSTFLNLTKLSETSCVLVQGDNYT